MEETPIAQAEDLEIISSKDEGRNSSRREGWKKTDRIKEVNILLMEWIEGQEVSEISRIRTV